MVGADSLIIADYQPVRISVHSVVIVKNTQLHRVI